MDGENNGKPMKTLLKWMMDEGEHLKRASDDVCPQGNKEVSLVIWGYHIILGNTQFSG